MKNLALARIMVISLFSTMLWADPTQEELASQHFDEFRAIYSKTPVTKAELRDALGLVLRSAELMPESYKYAYSAAATYDGLQEYDNAIRWYRKALTLAASDAQRSDSEVALQESRFMAVAMRNRSEDRPTHDMSISMILKGVSYEPEKMDDQPLPSIFPSSMPPEDRYRTVADRFAGHDVYTVPGFIVVSYHSRKSAKHHYQTGIEDFDRYFRARLFSGVEHEPVILFLSDDPFRLIQLTNKLYPDLNFASRHPFMGYFNATDNMIFATVRGGYGTLLHELMHAYFNAGYPAAPGWLEEGFATVYERTRWTPERLVPLPNWRMNGLRLQQVIDLAGYEKYQGDIPLDALDMARLRLLYLYLDERGQLGEFYRQVKSTGGSQSVAELARGLGVEQNAWAEFAENSFLDYQIDLAREQGRRVNPAETEFIQRALNATMNANLVEDGVWGNATKAALIAFQTQQGLEPDGVYGSRTRAALRREFSLTAMQQ